mgnify:CR=1 FL=1
MPRGGGAGAGAGLPGWLNWLARPLDLVLHGLVRGVWAWRRTRRLVRSRRTGWFGDLVYGPGKKLGKDFFVSADEYVTGLVWKEGDRSLEERERRLEQLLLRALLTDLARWGRPGRVSPWRRRRTTRFLLPIHFRDAQAARRGARFVEEFGKAVAATRCGVVALVVAAPAAGAFPGREVTLAAARRRLVASDAASDAASGKEPPTPLLVRLGKDAPPVDPHPVWTKHYRMGPATEAAAWCMAFVLTAGLAVWSLHPLSTDTTCLTTASAQAAADQAQEPPPPLTAAYAGARARIERQNEQADRAQQQGRTVRTEAYLGAGATDAEGELVRRSDGALPELRGIALAQQAVNTLAARDENRVFLRIALYDEAGERYVNAVDVAERIVRDARRTEPEIIGVVGFTQSRRESREAVRLLTDAGLPVVTTSATAGEMDSGHYFHAVAPPNNREARILTAFVRRANIIVQGDGPTAQTARECAPALAAVVVQDPEDLYSDSIGDLFAEYFDGPVRQVLHTPGGRPIAEPSEESVSAANSADEVAEEVCRAVTEEPRTVVYWAARTVEYQAFLHSYGETSACTDDPLTVLGGNELTNAVLSGTEDSPHWLRLYHTSHVLPVGSEVLSAAAQAFNEAYAEAFGEDDLWRNDGHAALAYDATQLLAQAAANAYRTVGDGLDAANVELILDEGVSRQGASGYLSFGSHEAYSADKPVIVLYHTETGASVPVLYCGRFGQDEDRLIDRWGPRRTAC